jgi:hypothetical protein
MGMSRSQQPPSPDEIAAKLFAAQHGAAADRQLRAAGFSWARQQRMIANNRWRREAPGVVFLVGAPQTWRQEAMAATLYWKGLNLLSGGPAARLHGCDGFTNVDSVQIALPYGGHDKTPDSVSVRWSRRLSTADRYVVDGIPVTTLPVTLLHLHADGLAAEKALDWVLRERKPPLWLKQNFERWQTNRPNDPATAMLELLEQRMGKRLPRSWFQRLAKRAFEEHGVTLVDEWPVHDAAGKHIADLDLANVDLKVGVECQSIQYHSTAADIARDRRRRSTLRRLGWDIVELWWSDLDRMDVVLDDLGKALERARKLLT